MAVGDPAARARVAAVTDGVRDTVTTELPVPGWPELVEADDCDLLVLDPVALPLDDAAATTIREALRGEHRPGVLLLADVGPEQRAQLLAAGCQAIVSQQVGDEALGELLTELVRRRQDAAQRLLKASQLQATPPPTEPEPERPVVTFGEYVSSDPQMHKFLQVARKTSRSDSTVLILGETGVGKERLARAIHAQSPRSSGPFVVLNCGAVPESLLETELFGHERGAFTGAVRAHRGHFELAHRGTIFLDEIGEMPLHLQVKLLRAIQERVVQRIGGEVPLPVDVRIVAATNRDLHAEMQERRFRSDLYYRLSVVTLEIPPLRQRPDDVRTLVDVYFQQFRTQIPTLAERVAPDAMRALQTYTWPGNIRELINVVERAVLLCEGDEITLADLPDAVAGAAGAALEHAGNNGRNGSPQGTTATPNGNGNGAPDRPALEPQWLHRPLAEARSAWNASFERAYLSGLLQQTHGRVGETATRAGIDPRSLYAKMKQHGLRKEDFR